MTLKIRDVSSAISELRLNTFLSPVDVLLLVEKLLQEKRILIFLSLGCACSDWLLGRELTPAETNNEPLSVRINMLFHCEETSGEPGPKMSHVCLITEAVPSRRSKHPDLSA